MRNTFVKRMTAICVVLGIATVGCGGVNASRCFPVPYSGAKPDPAPAQICHENDGQRKQARLELEGGVVLVDFDPSEYEIPQDVLWKWISDGARAVATYYGRFPVPQCLLRITPTEGRGAHWGQASKGIKMPTVLIVLGRQSKPEDFAEDWTLTHEFVHLAFPNVKTSHRWIEEGLATYIEPIAQYKIGRVTEESVWFEWLHSMKQGQPEEGDRGLDFTPRWGRVYWGGALFALVSEVAIRRESNNRTGLRQALRGIVDAGGTMAVWWKITDAFAAGDRAAQTHVLMTEYQKRRADPAPVDLETLWTNLGVRMQDGHIFLDDNAPWAATRRSILRD